MRCCRGSSGWVCVSPPVTNEDRRRGDQTPPLPRGSRASDHLIFKDLSCVYPIFDMISGLWSRPVPGLPRSGAPHGGGRGARKTRAPPSFEGELDPSDSANGRTRARCRNRSSIDTMSQLPATPLFPQVGVLAFVPDDWNPYW